MVLTQEELILVGLLLGAILIVTLMVIYSMFRYRKFGKATMRGAVYGALDENWRVFKRPQRSHR